MGAARVRLNNEIAVSLKTLKSASDARLIKNIPFKEIQKFVDNINDQPEESVINTVNDIQLMIKHVDSIKAIIAIFSVYKKNANRLFEELNTLAAFYDLIDKISPVTKSKDGINNEDDKTMDIIYEKIDSLRKQSSIYFNNGFYKIVSEEPDLDQSHWKDPDYLTEVKKKLESLTKTIPDVIAKVADFNEKHTVDTLRIALINKTSKSMCLLKDNFQTLTNTYKEIEHLNHDDAFRSAFKEQEKEIAECKKLYEQLLYTYGTRENLENKSLTTVKDIKNKIVTVDNRVTLTLRVVNDIIEREKIYHIEQEANKEKLYQQFTVFTNMVSELLHVIRMIENNAEKMTTYMNKQCMEEVVDYIPSEKKQALKSIDNNIRTCLRIIEKGQELFKVIKKAGSFTVSQYNDVNYLLEEISNEVFLSQIKTHIGTANDILAKQIEIINKGRQDYIDKRNQLTNDINQYSTDYFDKIKTDYDQKIEALEKKHEKYFIEISKNLQRTQRLFKKNAEKYQDGIEKKLEQDGQSFFSNLLTWLSGFLPYIKNTKREALIAEKNSAKVLADNFHSHCNALYSMNHWDSQIEVIFQSKSIMAAHQNNFLYGFYEPLIQDSKKLEKSKQDLLRGTATLEEERDKKILWKKAKLGNLKNEREKVNQTLINFMPDEKKYDAKCSIFNWSNTPIRKNEPIFNSSVNSSDGSFLSLLFNEVSAFIKNSFFSVKQLISPEVEVAETKKAPTFSSSSH